MNVLRRTLTILELIDMQGDGDGNVTFQEVTNYLNILGATGALEQDIKMAATEGMATIRTQLSDVQKRLSTFR